VSALVAAAAGGVVRGRNETHDGGQGESCLRRRRRASRNTDEENRRGRGEWGRRGGRAPSRGAGDDCEGGGSGNGQNRGPAALPREGTLPGRKKRRGSGSPAGRGRGTQEGRGVQTGRAERGKEERPEEGPPERARAAAAGGVGRVREGEVGGQAASRAPEKKRKGGKTRNRGRTGKPRRAGYDRKTKERGGPQRQGSIRGSAGREKGETG